MSTAVVVVPRAHWVNGWFLQLFSRPVVRVNGTDHAGRWGRPTVIEVAAGAHRVAVGARYRATQAIVGIQELTVDIGEEQRSVLDARNGFFNHQPFSVTERAYL